jgi:hypothetical protein
VRWSGEEGKNRGRQGAGVPSRIFVRRRSRRYRHSRAADVELFFSIKGALRSTGVINANIEVNLDFVVLATCMPLLLCMSTISSSVITKSTFSIVRISA